MAITLAVGVPQTLAGNFTTPGTVARIQLQLTLTLTSQSINDNKSYGTWSLGMQEYVNGSPYSNDHTSTAYATVNVPVLAAGGLDYDFNLTNEYIGVAGGSWEVTHNADGTKYFSASASYNGNDPIGSASLGDTVYVPTIPRATTPVCSTLTPATGAPVTITLTPASSGFSHRLRWAFQPGTGGAVIDDKIIGLAGGGGSATGTVEAAAADGTAGNYWGLPAGTTSPTLTIPHGVFAQAIDQDTRTVTLTVDTYSGATLIGTRTVALQATLAASQKPTIAGITHSEATTSPNVASLIGAYVQSVTKLALALTSPAGVFGSTIASRQITVAGQVLTANGTTPNPIADSGTVTISATVTDSRGRTSDAVTQTITVLAWSPPAFAATPIVVRALSSGITDEDDGTYLKIDPADFSASTLVVATVQKNKIEYRLSYRLVGAGSWTVDGTGWIDPPNTPSVIRFTGTALSTFGSVALGSAYEVMIEIRDVLATSFLTRIVPKAAVLLQLKGSIGVSIGARHSGAANALEVWGRGKQASDGLTLRDIIDRGDLDTTINTVLQATSNVPAIVEPGYTDGLAKVYLNGSSSLSPVGYPWLYPYEPEQSDSVLMLPTPGGSFAIGGKLNTKRMFPAQINLVPLAGWANYADATPLADRFSNIKVTRSTEGIVVLAGLLRAGTVTSGTVITKLPDGFRPDYDLLIPVLSSGVGRLIAIMANGDVKIFGGLGDTSLSSIAFPAAGVANWTLLGPGTPYPYQNGWSTDATAGYNWGPPRIWKEPVTGQVFLQAAVKNAVGNPPDSTVFAIPSSFNAANEELFPLVNSGNTFGYWRTRPSNTDVIILTNGGASGYNAIVPLVSNWRPAVGGTMTWTSRGFPVGSWVNYGGIFANVEWAKSPGGIVFLRGLPKLGTMVTAILQVEAGYRPKYQPRDQAAVGASLIALTVSNSTIGRVDIYGSGSSGGGSIIPVQGNPAWVSFSGLVWAAEQ